MSEPEMGAVWAMLIELERAAKLWAVAKQDSDATALVVREADLLAIVHRMNTTPLPKTPSLT